MTAARFGRGTARVSRRGRFRDVLLALALLAALAAVANRLNPPPTFSGSGVARVHDGDTLTVAGERVRLIGIDAPELKQVCRRGEADYPCGRVSRDALIGLIGGQPVSCDAAKRDRYRRLLGQCRAGDVGLNAALVLAGWAVAYGPEFSGQEAAARTAREGLWAGTFEPPKEWRTRHGDAGDLEYGPLVEWLVRFGEAVGLLDPAPVGDALEAEEP